ncbi:MAG: thymidylate synthase (FAD), partial [Dinoroseobacter sp.]|nr:thymidylate synthase (FAD) [Dinoroseobacter sp.]
RLGAVQVSAKGAECLRKRLAGETVTQESSGMSKGEWREFVAEWGE